MEVQRFLNFDFKIWLGPEKLPGLSRNGPQARKRWFTSQGGTHAQLALILVLVNGIKHLGVSLLYFHYTILAKTPWNNCTLSVPSAVFLEMWLQSNADTTTLQKGSGKRKGAKFSKVFQGFCPRLKLISVRETNCVNQWFIWGIKLSMFLASGARVRDTKLCPISCPKNINDTANGPLQI